MKQTVVLLFCVIALIGVGCSRFHNAPANSQGERFVVISPVYDNNIGPPQVVQQLQQLNMPMKTFTAKNDSFDGTKALIREMGAYFHKDARAEELCNTLLDSQRTASLEKVKLYADHPRVAVIHFHGDFPKKFSR